MAQTVTVQLTSAGINTGPFAVYGEDGLGGLTLVASGVSRLSLLGGQTYSNVPDNAVNMVIQSQGVCTNSVLIAIQ